MDRINLKTDLGPAVAKALEGMTLQDWHCKTFHDWTHSVALVREADGLEIFMGQDTHKDRLTFRWSSHADAYKICKDTRYHRADVKRYDEDWPGITCSPKKTPEALAKDVCRRLLNDAEEFHIRALEQVNYQVKAENKVDSFVQTLRDAGIVVRSLDRNEIYDGRFDVCGDGWRLDISPHSREFKGYGLSDSQLIAILEVLDAPNT